jgi:hypothetical protein
MLAALFNGCPLRRCASEPVQPGLVRAGGPAPAFTGREVGLATRFGRSLIDLRAESGRRRP